MYYKSNTNQTQIKHRSNTNPTQIQHKSNTNQTNPNHHMPFNASQFVQLIISLPALCLITYGILESIGFMQMKSNGCICEHAITSFVLMFCVDTILKTWLKTVVASMECMQNKPNNTIIIYNASNNMAKKEDAGETGETGVDAAEAKVDAAKATMDATDAKVDAK